jgi:hypothetical protein
MGVQNSDLVIIERSGGLYRATTQEMADYISSVLGTSEYTQPDIEGRNALEADGKLSLGDRVMVEDASADANVTAGWAVYQKIGVDLFRRIAEEESLDMVLSTTDLSKTATANTVTIISSDGNDVTINAASITEAGMMSAGDKLKVDRLTVSDPINLDTLLSKSHVAATASGDATTNPLQVGADQVLSFSIAALATLP